MKSWMTPVVALALALPLPALAGATNGPLIEVEARFIEISAAGDSALGAEWRSEGSNATSRLMETDEFDHLLSQMTCRGHVDLLSAPKLRTASGVEGEIKVVTEYSVATDIDVRPVMSSNMPPRQLGVLVVPQFMTREVGVTLRATPTYSPEDDTITLAITTGVVTEPTWTPYEAIYRDESGSERSLDMQRPAFHVRHIDIKALVLPRNTTVVCAGLRSQGTSIMQERIPGLAAIPWLGRLFRNTKVVTETKNYMITVSARVIDPQETP